VFASALAEREHLVLVSEPVRSGCRWMRSSLIPRDRVAYSDVDVRAAVACFATRTSFPSRTTYSTRRGRRPVLEHVLYPERVAAEMHRVLVREAWCTRRSFPPAGPRGRL